MTTLKPPRSPPRAASSEQKLLLSPKKFQGGERAVNSLNYHDDDLVDVVFMYRNGNEYEERSLADPTSNAITGLLQGQSVNKLPTDADYYKGDRYIVENRPMLQIHKVILKNDMEGSNNNFKKGDKTIMLA